MAVGIKSELNFSELYTIELVKHFRSESISFIFVDFNLS